MAGPGKKYKTWFECIVAVYQVALDWSLNVCLLTKVLSMQDKVGGADRANRDAFFPESQLTASMHACTFKQLSSMNQSPITRCRIPRAKLFRLGLKGYGLSSVMRKTDTQDEDEQPEADNQAVPGARPQTRKELSDLHEHFSSKLHMAVHLYQDTFLAMEFKVMFWGTYYLMKEFSEILEQQRLGQARRDVGFEP